MFQTLAAELEATGKDVLVRIELTPLKHGPTSRWRCLILRRDGIKSLYSDRYFTPQEWAQAYGLSHDPALKAKYNPTGRMLGLDEKCVLRA